MRNDNNKRGGIEEALPDGLDRRRFVQGAGTGLVAVTAGCFGGSDGGGGNGDDGGGTDSGNGSDGGYEVDQIHILMDYANEAWQDRWEKVLIPGFEDETGVSVNIEYVGFQGTSEQRLQTLMQSGDYPNSYQGSTSETADIISAGNAIPVTDVNQDLTETNGEFAWDPSLITFGDEQWFVPHLTYTAGTVSYRTDVFDDLGLEPAETWDELLSNAEAIDADSNTEARGYNVGGTKAGQASSEFRTYLRCAGGGLFRRRSDSQEEVEVWFDEDRALETLEFMQQLAQYSPDPSQTTWTASLKYWAAGRVAQCWHLNAWTAGIADNAGVSSIARNTDITPTPVKADADPIDRGFTSPDGATLLDTDGAEATKDFFRYIYGTIERTVENLLMEPMRSAPPYEGLIENETYRNADVHQKYDGHLYELNRKNVEEVLPELSSPDRPATPATRFVLRFPILAEMVNRVLIVDDPPKAAYDEALSRLEDRLQEGKEKAAVQFG
ncbi:MAG: ABC transporter substrate-binding protein [Haloarculaceae archaeon]